MGRIVGMPLTVVEMEMVALSTAAGDTDAADCKLDIADAAEAETLASAERAAVEREEIADAAFEEALMAALDALALKAETSLARMLDMLGAYVAGRIMGVIGAMVRGAVGCEAITE